MKPPPPDKEPALRANERPAQTNGTNCTSSLNPRFTEDKPALSLLVAIFDGIGAVAMWFLKGGSR